MKYITLFGLENEMKITIIKDENAVYKIAINDFTMIHFIKEHLPLDIRHELDSMACSSILKFEENKNE